jgi:hypothetical protein
MDYITAEVRAVCREKGWRCQIRRKWSVREKPVSVSDTDDYEWKLVPLADTESPTDLHAESQVTEPEQFEEGTYFVLRTVTAEGKVALEHDTHHAGVMGDHWFTRTFTEIDLERAGTTEHHKVAMMEKNLEAYHRVPSLPPSGLLRRILLKLTARFEPNHFSIT